MSPLAEYFADELRRAREEAGMTQEQLAVAIHKSKATVAMVESCQRKPQADLAADVDKALKTGGRFERMRRWMLRAETDPSWFAPWREHEREATEIRWFGPLTVPGLLQTEEFAAALLDDPDQVAGRLERQEVLDRASVTVIIDEGVLYRRIGSREVMYRQLVELATTNRATVQVLPADSDVYLAVDGPFIVAVVDGRELAYVETPLRGFVLEDASMLGRAGKRWRALLAESLPRNLSRELIMKVADERWKID